MTPAGDFAAGDYSQPTHSCDIVMKGGITSGVVYPHAVCELAQTYRFRSVGGTSAGAIAAAAAAAAEYGRERGGFRKLASLPDWIGAGENLQSLFQPQRSTRRLHAVLIAKIGGGWLKAVATALWRHWQATLLGALPGLALIALALSEEDGAGPLVTVALVLGALLVPIGIALGVVAHLARQLTHAVPDNGFGICGGGPGSKRGGPMPLTPWLTDLLNDTAGLAEGEVLTFGHLWAGPDGDRAAARGADAEHHLDLAMMTTNLTNHRAHQLPWTSREWFFKPEEFRRLFPREVVDWMVAHPQESPPPGSAAAQDSRMRRALFPDLLPLPEPGDLPVVVATRMSLSFPLLLSAVPLWNLDMTNPANAVLKDWNRWARTNGLDWDPLASKVDEWSRQGQPPARPIAEPCWFSDGGISSNFPVHFFDRLVPRWPTFAINLRPFPLGRERDDHDQEKNTEMAKANGDGVRDWWYRLPERPGWPGVRDGRLFAFLSSIMRTMQNRADEAQMRVPGYRDRVAHVNMSDDEGGMNLTMPYERIKVLTERGEIAARRLREAYTAPERGDRRITWDNHRWVRLRSSLGVLEEMHERFSDGIGTPPEIASERTYAELLDPAEDPPSYEWTGDVQAQLALDEVAAIEASAALSNETNTVLDGAPKPTPEGRIGPKG